MAKHILHSSDDELDFVLIGLSCPEDQYRTSSLINNTLQIDLCLSDYIPFNLKDGKIFKFSLFRFVDKELGLEYFFVPNTSNFEEPRFSVDAAPGLFAGLDVDERVKLIKELPRTDYFLILKGEDLHMHQFKICDRLKNVSEIVQIQTIEPNDLPSKRNLIF